MKILADLNPVFPDKLKISLRCRSCELEPLPDQKKSPDSSWSMADSFLVIKKINQKTKLTKENNRIVDTMWFNILPDIPVF